MPTYSCPKCGALGVEVLVPCYVYLDHEGEEFHSDVLEHDSDCYARCGESQSNNPCDFEGTLKDFTEPETLAEFLAEER